MKSKSVTGFTAIVIALLFAAQSVHAQAPTALTKIMNLEGKWEGPATLVLNGTTYNFTYKFEFKKTANGSGLYMDETFTHAGLGTLYGANLIGYNANDGKIHWLSVDNFGTCHDHLGVFISNNHFYMDVHETAGGQPFFEKIDIQFKGNNKIEITLEASLNGQVFETVSGTFLKQ
jgi:hypothetical protein